MGISDVGDSLPGLDEATRLVDNAEMIRYADKAMFEAKAMQVIGDPKVHLLWMTSDPLGAIAAACRMYEGVPTYNLGDITDEERRHYFAQVQRTHLTAPLEFVKMHFFIEGVDRAFTHQIVRQRTAVFAQESLRFAVKTNLAQETSYPPSFSDGRVYGNQSGRNDLFDIWDGAMAQIESAYKALIAAGVPAEDARGLLPHAVTTRLNYCTDLRNLADHAGNRLCTQAQHHWKVVFQQIRQTIRDFGPPETSWQFELLTDSNLFSPICFKTGKCEFKADFDRGCTIRERVDAGRFGDIQQHEWLEDSEAGWVR
jgi:thymidylate synthase (FAD)